MMSISILRGRGTDLVSYGSNDPTAALRRDDYYRECGQAPASLMGSGWGFIGVNEYDSHTLVSMLDGYHPRTGKRIAKAHPRRVSGFDLTLSAPKSVSTIGAVADEDIRRAIQMAHSLAVSRAINHIEQCVSFTRRGKAGIDLQREPAKLLAVEYLHGSSRAGDPNLHSHVLVPNLALRPDGTLAALDGQPLLRHKMAAGAIYRSELAHQLRTIGLQIEREGDFFSIAGVPKSLVDEWSKRREQVLSALRKTGFHGAKSAEIAALSTRDDKPESTADELRAQWTETSQRHGFDQITVKQMTDTGLHNQTTQHRSAMPAFSTLIEKLTAHTAVVSIHDIYRAVATEAQGITDADGIDAYVAELLRSRDIVRLVSDHGALKFTSRDLYTRERQAMRSIANMANSQEHRVPPPLLEKAFFEFDKKNVFSLSSEQQAAVEHICGHGLVLIGAAGTGKSTTLQAARMAWELVGLSVTGCSTSGKAAAGLQESSGIPSTTIAKLLLDLERGERTLDAQDVVMVDEAGMVDSRDYHALATQAEAAGAKLVLVGDHKQLQAVGAGGLFKAISDRFGAAEITQVRRQREQWGRDMSRSLRNAEVAQGLQVLADRGLLHISDDRDSALSAMVEQWGDLLASDADLTHHIMVADYNRDVDRLNLMARQRQVSTLHIINEIDIQTRDREGNSTGTLRIGEGERVLFRRNNSNLGIHNGDLCIIQRIDWRSDESYDITARMDNGDIVKFNSTNYASLAYGYAVTTHKAQGASVENVVVLGGSNLNSTYVGLTRFRTTTHLTLVRDSLDRAAELEEPSEQMLEAAMEVATKLSIALDPAITESFIECREFLNAHGVMMGQWQSGVSELLKVMSREYIKETTLQYSSDTPIDASEDDFDTPPIHMGDATNEKGLFH